MERKWRSIRTSPVGERMKRDWIIASSNVFALIVSSSVVIGNIGLGVGVVLLVVGVACCRLSLKTPKKPPKRFFGLSIMNN